MTLLIINKSRLMPTGAKASYHGRLFLFHHLPETEANHGHSCHDGNAYYPQEHLKDTVKKIIHTSLILLQRYASIFGFFHTPDKFFSQA